MSSEKCPMCNRRPTKLVPMYDNGSGPKVCHSCKKKIKKGETIEKFKLSEEIKNA